MFSFSKNQRLIPAAICNQLDQQWSLLFLVYGANPLLNRGCRSIARANRNLYGVAHQTLGQTTDIIGKSGRKHQILAASRQQANNSLDIMDKTHIQHTVGFVEHQYFKVVELYCILAVQIH